MKTNVKKASEAYSAGNREAAQIMLADPMKYPGVLQEWALAVMAKERQ